MAQLSIDVANVSVDFDDERVLFGSVTRDVPDAPGLKWSLYAYPRGVIDDMDLDVYISVVGGRATVIGQIQIVDYRVDEKMTKNFKFDFVNDQKQGFVALMPSGCESVFDVTCIATFLIQPAVVAPLKVHEMIDSANPNCFDATIKVGKSEIKVNRGFMSLASPVFCAMFGSDTKESQTGIVNIVDFTHETVKNALDYCYGRNVEHIPMVAIIDMLRFYDKYDIQAAIKKLEAWLKDNLTVETFVPIAAYAFTHSLEPLQADCGQMFHKHVDELSHLPEFIELDPAVVSAIFKAGAAAGKAEEANKIDDKDD
uniref:BTB domain-containing protein n=1 Tax=Panagrellus redivivus TaxID=6233 RepID=A0A7E4WA36_PANRE